MLSSGVQSFLVTAGTAVSFSYHESWTHARNVMDSVLQATWFVCFYFFERSRLKKVFFFTSCCFIIPKKVVVVEKCVKT